MNLPTYKERLNSLREARNHAIQALEITNPGHHEAETSLALSWGVLFEHFCSNKDITLPHLDAISTIIHKLTSSYTQLKSLELKTRELFLKEDSHNIKKSHLLPSANPPNTLSLETIQNIEHQLNLL